RSPIGLPPRRHGWRSSTRSCATTPRPTLPEAPDRVNHPGAGSGSGPGKAPDHADGKKAILERIAQMPVQSPKSRRPTE
ncbi:MAG TPA: hypothetical protein VNL91_01390, partial [Thermoanaerobaculia bacterium]|nr:hypothetical protein [Thermoanaerobaculia bacterium]